MRRSRHLLVPLLFAAVALIATACSASAELVNNDLPALSEPAESTELAEATEPIEPAEAESIEPEPKPEPEAEPEPAESVAAGPSEQRGPIVDIRTVDFKNGFTYEDPAFGEGTATVTDGGFENGEFGDTEYFWFGVDTVAFGDLNGDGIEEAVVSTGYSGGGSGYFQSVRAFGLIEGAVTPLGVVPFGDRAFGGVGKITVDSGFVSALTFFNGEGSCCPTEAVIARLVLGDNSLVQADMSTPLAYVSLSRSDEENVLSFLPGTSGAYAAIWGRDVGGAFSIEAGAGQVLTIDVLSGSEPSGIDVVDTSTGEQVAAWPSVALPADAIYEVDVQFDGPRDEGTVLLVQIDAEPETITWEPAVEQVLVSTDPPVASSVTWPIFGSEVADDASVAAANEALTAQVLGFDDLWIEDVTEFSTPQGESSYEVAYEVSYAEDDLVGVHFSYYDYVCCRPYPNYGPRTAVVDLQEGRLIPTSEILDLDRVDEINALWFAALGPQGQLPAEALDAIDPAEVGFESVGLVPGGIEFGTGRNALGGGSAGSVVVLTFGELGDLVQPAFRDRLG